MPAVPFSALLIPVCGSTSGHSQHPVQALGLPGGCLMVLMMLMIML